MTVYLLLRRFFELWMFVYGERSHYWSVFRHLRENDAENGIGLLGTEEPSMIESGPN